MQKTSLNYRPMLTLEKEIISKADVATIQNMSAYDNWAPSQDTSLPTIPPTLGSTVLTTKTTSIG